MSESKLVRIYPVPGVSLYPGPTEVQDVTPKQWAELKKYIPRPFTDKNPEPDTEPEIYIDELPTKSEGAS